MKRSPAARVLAAVVLLAAVNGSSNAQQSDTPYSLSGHPSQDGRCEGDAGNGDLDRSEAACLAQASRFAQRIRRALLLKFTRGGAKVYLNDDAACERADAERCIKYQLTGFFPRHELLLIELDYWEGVEWLLVRAASGEATKIVSPPHYSPNQDWLVAVSASENPRPGGDGIDIVPTTPDRTARQWHYRVPEGDDSLYEFAGWDGEMRVKLTVSSLKNPMERVPATVDLIDGEWRMSRPVAPPARP